MQVWHQSTYYYLYNYFTKYKKVKKINIFGLLFSKRMIKE
jgi:hypothetical protein